MEMSEYHLILLLKNDDKEAYKIIFKSYYLELYYLALKYIKVPDDANDVSQSSFIKLSLEKGSLAGILMRWTEKAPSAARTLVHTLAVDSHAGILGWQSKAENNVYTLEDTDRKQKWSLRIYDDGSFGIKEANSGQSYSVILADGVWSLKNKDINKK